MAGAQHLLHVSPNGIADLSLDNRGPAGYTVLNCVLYTVYRLERQAIISTVALNDLDTLLFNV